MSSLNLTHQLSVKLFQLHLILTINLKYTSKIVIEYMFDISNPNLPCGSCGTNATSGKGTINSMPLEQSSEIIIRVI